eukprot:scpid46843/ scgid35468/ 5&apos; DNA cross-link repair 1B protein; SNM1 homolog B
MNKFAVKRATGPGVIIPHTSIAVDCWRLDHIHRLYYFCSHAHTDHLIGLQPSWSHPLYCSEITARLLIHRYGFKKDILGILELNTPTLVANFTVTCLDANHCPGSVMFLFEGPFGTILHTGDFRYSPSFHVPLHPVLRGEKHVDMLYLDNSYCNPTCIFPTREKATDKILDIVRQADPRQQRVYIVTYNIGKESLLEKIALAMRVPIVVSKKRMEILQLLGVRDVFTTEEESHIHSVTMSEAGNIIHRLESDWYGDIVIRPTALLTAKRPTDIGQGSNSKCHMVPYSDHSSFSELQQFVAAVNPVHLRGILSGDSGAAKNFSCTILYPLCRAKEGKIWLPATTSETTLLQEAGKVSTSPTRIAAAFRFKRRGSTQARPASSKKICYHDTETDGCAEVSPQNGEDDRKPLASKLVESSSKPAPASHSDTPAEPLVPYRPRLNCIFSNKTAAGYLLPSTSEKVSGRDADDEILLLKRTTSSDSAIVDQDVTSATSPMLLQCEDTKETSVSWDESCSAGTADLTTPRTVSTEDECPPPETVISSSTCHQSDENSKDRAWSTSGHEVHAAHAKKDNACQPLAAAWTKPSNMPSKDSTNVDSPHGGTKHQQDAPLLSSTSNSSISSQILLGTSQLKKIGKARKLLSTKRYPKSCTPSK